MMHKIYFYFSQTDLSFLFFFQCMSVRGKFLESYMPQIKGILRKALRIQNKEGHGLGKKHVP